MTFVNGIEIKYKKKKLKWLIFFLILKVKLLIPTMVISYRQKHKKIEYSLNLNRIVLKAYKTWCNKKERILNTTNLATTPIRQTLNNNLIEYEIFAIILLRDITWIDIAGSQNTLNKYHLICIQHNVYKNKRES